jgi:aminopeptidase N
MNTDDNQTSTQDPETMLRRKGWHSSDWKQIEVYAQMSPARKVEQMLRIRHAHVQTLKRRLKQEHPDCTAIELARILEEHLDLERENRTDGR